MIIAGLIYTRRNTTEENIGSNVLYTTIPSLAQQCILLEGQCYLINLADAK